ncbi:signal recognition particle-docking protein FtsY [Piscinibacter sakaiensis]|uniref:signal recognition particle-docking protein FtsY n=1 Tax=Piscinibacter sakaiensis TaxID=1547922 RepID=UPI003AAA5779
MFSFFKKRKAAAAEAAAKAAQQGPSAEELEAASINVSKRSAEPATEEPAHDPFAFLAEPLPGPSAEEISAQIAAEIAAREAWRKKLRGGLRKTGSALSAVFTTTKVDEQLYEELEAALLMSDTGVKATQFLLDDLRRRVKQARETDPMKVKELLSEAIVDLLQPLEKALVVGQYSPTVMMVVGVNGAGKTTSIGKLTRYLSDHGQKVLLAAADTFRAAAREQLAVWAERSDAHSAGGARAAGLAPPAPVEFVSQTGGDPAAVAFDAVAAGRARRSDVVIADTAGRLPTQLHLMEELKKIKRVITKAQPDAPHEVLLVIDGNTGQNALSQVKAFDEALQLTGLIVTKLDGTAKGGVMAAIALWSRERAAAKPGAGGVPIYFIGVGEQLEDLQTFNAREFAQALLG